MDGIDMGRIFTTLVQETATQTYTMESGTEVTLDAPLLVTPGTVVLTDDYQTLQASLRGTRASTMTVTVSGSLDGGSKAIAVRNLRLAGQRQGTNAPTVPTADTPTVSPTATAPVSALIHEIQGVTETSPMVGQSVRIRGIVTGDFQANDADESRDLDGFYLQEPEENYDDNPLTSEGIFVYDGRNPAVDVSVGNVVEVVGTVQEFFGETQIRDVTMVTIVDAGFTTLPSETRIHLLSSPLNTTIDANDDYQPDLEAYEGMLVIFPERLQIVEMFRLARFNEVKLVAGDRPVQFTQLNQPNAAAYDRHLEELGRRRITYDDGLNQQNALIGNLEGFGPVYGTDNAPRMGDSIISLTGVLSYQWAGNGASSSKWHVRSNGQEPLNEFAPTNPRPEEPPLAVTIQAEVFMRIVALNVLNFLPPWIKGTIRLGPVDSILVEPTMKRNTVDSSKSSSRPWWK